jgi:uncharacterized BrkB/YihY/UPF0761 family membrane protein
MSALDIFALIVLLVLLVTIVAVIGILGALPGRIARQRHHPQADAIAVGGWLGLLFFGLLWPLVMIWAYTRTGDAPPERERPATNGQERAA